MRPINLSVFYSIQWRIKGGGGVRGGTRLGARPLGTQQHIFSSHLKVCLKMRIIMEKSVKIVSASGAPPLNSCWPPVAVGSAPRPPRCYSLLLLPVVEFVYSTQMRFIAYEKEKNICSKCSTVASFALLHLSFTSNSVVCVDGGRKNVSCPRAQGTLATPLTVHQQKRTAPLSDAFNILQ